jgi:hypothetical protein
MERGWENLMQNFRNMKFFLFGKSTLGETHSNPLEK